MSKLNKDILFLLFEELQDDSKSLFSCLLVNRLWCETVVPILWRDPWCYDDNINYHNKSSLYNIIISFLSDDVKEFLTTQGIQIPQTSHQSFLFDYLLFCRSFNINILNIIISIGSPSAYKQFLLQQEIYNLFMRKCSELKYLDMRSLKHQIFYFIEAKTRLDSLCEIKCDTSIDPTYFYGLARICQFIQRLIIINTDINLNNGIVKLIDLQRNLKYFEWKDDLNDFDDSVTGDTYEEIFQTLERKADTLVHFVTSFQDFDYYYGTIPIKFSKFHNLKTLIINDSCLEFEHQLKNSCFQKLEILQIDYIQISTIISIINNSRGNLKKILVDGYDDIDNDDYLVLIRTIHKNCPLIEHLTLAFSSTKEHFIEFEVLIEKCQNLKTLILSINAFTNDEYKSLEERKFASGDRLTKALINSASNNLREIRFGEFYPLYPGFKFSLETLKTFLENWRSRIPLSIITSDHHYKGKEYTEMLSRYKKDGVIKDFKCGSLRDIYFSYRV